MKETNISQLVRIKASELGLVISRNNSGKLQDTTGRWVSFGVFCPGGSDLIGWRSIKITEDMVGKNVAIFTAIEVKQPNKKPTPEQVLFLNFVRKSGGIAAVITSPDELESVLNSQ